MKRILAYFFFAIVALSLRSQPVSESEWKFIPIGYLNLDKSLFFRMAMKCDSEGDYENAKLFYESAADKGHGRACGYLAFRYMEGKFSSKRDFKKALEWAYKGIERNDPLSLSAYGIILFHTSKSVNDKIKALEPLEKSYQNGCCELAGANIISVCYLLKGEYTKAVEWAEKVLSKCEVSRGGSFYIAKAILSKIYMDLGTLSHPIALKYAEESANWDNPLGNYVLGRMLIEYNIDPLKGLVLIEEALKYDYPRLIDIDVFHNEILEYYNDVKDEY